MGNGFDPRASRLTDTDKAGSSLGLERRLDDRQLERGKVMHKRLLRTVVAALVVVAGMQMSVAQTADSDTSTLEEIIVTAQKRPENVNTVPIVMTVLTNQERIETGIGSTQQLEWATAGLVFGNTNGFAEPYIRGIGTDLITPGQDSPVGFYLDGVYLPFVSSLLQQFGDISRVEILKGPQGTLYGRNTTGGAVNIITRDPEHAFSADAGVSAGNLGYAKATTYVTGGLTNDLSANFSGVYTIHNGLFDVLNTGGRLDALDQFGLRGKIKYDITEGWDILFGVDYENKNDSSDSASTVLLGSDALPLGSQAPFRTRSLYTILDPPPNRTATDYGSNLTVHGHMSWTDFTAISGFREDYLQSLSDGSETLLPLLAYRAFEGEQQFTQEFQFTSPDSLAVQWIAGLYILKGNAFEGPVNVWGGGVPITGAANFGVLDGRTRITSYAVYGQASYALPDGFRLIAGLRSSYEQRRLTEQTDFAIDYLDPAVRAAMGLPPLVPSKSWTSTKPKATLQWENPGQLLYASYSTAFKAGSYNLIATSSPGPLGPEDIKAYEVGGKHALPLLNHGHLNWAIFYYDYSNIQVATQAPGVEGIAASQNAATTISKGIDLDLALALVRNTTFTIGMEYLDARYESFPDAQVPNIVDGELGTDTPTGYEKSVDASGNRAERSPLLTTTAQFRWVLPIGPGNILTTANYYHNSGFYFDPGDETQQKGYNLVNVYVQYAPQGNPWSVAAWINNAFNATVLAGIAASPYVLGGFYNDPRLFGLSASVHF
jgi:iron complex outermembrane receptor protein